MAEDLSSVPAGEGIRTAANLGRVLRRHPRGRKHVLDSICRVQHTLTVKWEVDFHDDFVPEYHELPRDVQDELLASIKVLEEFGPQLGRPQVDTLKGLGTIT